MVKTQSTYEYEIYLAGKLVKSGRIRAPNSSLARDRIKAWAKRNIKVYLARV